MINWFEYILHHMRAEPDKPALVMENRVVTYGMLKAGMERCAHRIAGLQLARGEPVAVVYRDPIRHLTLCLALYRLGLASLSLEHGNANLGALKIGAMLGDEEAEAVKFPLAHAVAVTDDWFAADAPSSAALPDGVGGDEVCRLCLTSGSTGEPRLVAITREKMARRLRMYFSAPWSVVLNLPSLGTTLGFVPACAALTAGRTLCFALSPFQAARMIDVFAIDFVNATTEQLVALTRVARKTGAPLRTLRTVHVGGSMPTRAMLEAAAIYVCRDVQNRYAGTELGCMAIAGAREILQKPGLAGHIEPGIEIGIFDDGGKPLPVGKLGRVKARYADSEEDWIDIGDVGRLGPENLLYIAGRSADGAAGRDISPMHEIEHLLRLEWDATDAGAVMMESASDKPDIWVGTVDCKEASAAALEVLAHARGIDCAIKLIALPAIPRTANGKIHRAQLKAALQAAAAGKA